MDIFLYRNRKVINADPEQFIECVCGGGRVGMQLQTRGGLINFTIAKTNILENHWRGGLDPLHPPSGSAHVIQVHVGIV